ncbi:MAG: nitric oxide reductase, partial [Gammaproteobacteria bacterium]|nr:nitric oxide reductase [Gammaproteobacteria bacterium]MBY0544360.1 nitric oxide reductase [Gammaproteobacteria bacterium]
MENKLNLTAKPINFEPDRIANVLKWFLLLMAFVCFAVVAWGTYRTYQEAPPLPKQFVTATGQMVMAQEDIIAGKAGFQKADLMDYGSIYGMGSYF